MSTTALTNPGSVDALKAELASAKAERLAIEGEIRRKLSEDAKGGKAYPETEHEADRQHWNGFELKIERISARLEAAEQAEAEAEKNVKAQRYRDALAQAAEMSAAHDQLIATMRQQADALTQTLGAILKARGEFADARNAAHGARRAIHYKRQTFTPEESHHKIEKSLLEPGTGRRYRFLDMETNEPVDASLIPSQIDTKLRADGCNTLSSGRSKAGAEELGQLEVVIDQFLSQ